MNSKSCDHSILAERSHSYSLPSSIPNPAGTKLRRRRSATAVLGNGNGPTRNNSATGNRTMESSAPVTISSSSSLVAAVELTTNNAKQLNVSRGGVIYENARTRRVRHRDILRSHALVVAGDVITSEKYNNPNAIVPLKRRHNTSATSSFVQDHANNPRPEPVVLPDPTSNAATMSSSSILDPIVQEIHQKKITKAMDQYRKTVVGIKAQPSYNKSVVVKKSSKSNPIQKKSNDVAFSSVSSSQRTANNNKNSKTSRNHEKMSIRNTINFKSQKK